MSDYDSDFDVAYYSEDNKPNAQAIPTIQTLRARPTPMTISSQNELTNTINNTFEASKTKNFSVQQYQNCGCTELVHSLPTEPAELMEAKKIAGSFTCTMEDHKHNYAQTRKILTDPSKSDLATAIDDLGRHKNNEQIVVNEYSQILDEGRSCASIPDEILDGLMQRDSTADETATIIHDPNNVTRYGVASMVAPAYGHSPSSVITRYDPCGCHLVVTLPQEVPRKSTGAKVPVRWKRSVMKPIRAAGCPNKERESGHDGSIGKVWTASSLGSTIAVVYKSLLSLDVNPEKPFVHVHVANMGEQEYNNLFDTPPTTKGRFLTVPASTSGTSLDGGRGRRFGGPSGNRDMTSDARSPIRRRSSRTRSSGGRVSRGDSYRPH